MTEPAVVNIDELLDSYGLTLAGRQYVDFVRTNPPDRAVTANAVRNCTVRFASRRMGRVIQAESRTIEAAYAIEREFDLEDTVEFWDQPRAVSIVGTRADGATYRAHYTADFLVLRKSGIQAVQLKPLSKLQRLVEQRPDDWWHDGTRFHYRPATKAFAELGIPHEVVDSSQLNQLRIENLLLLLSARYNKSDQATSRVGKRVLKFICLNKIAKIRELKEALGIVDLTAVYQLLAAGHLFADINNQLLTDLDNAWICESPNSLVLLDEVTHRLLPKLASVSTAEIPTPSDALCIAERLAQIAGTSLEKPKSDRTIRRYKRALRLANGDNRALVTGYKNCGNRLPRLTIEHERFIDTQIELHYKTVASPTIYGAFRMYANEVRNNPAHEALRPPVQYKTFEHRVDRQDAEVVARSRGGRRAANAAAPPVTVQDRGFWPTRPFMRNHIDHYLLDQLVVIAKAERRIFTARPWVTVVRDDYCDDVVGLSLGFLPPSRRACAKAIRDCVRRTGKMSEFYVMDGGADFESAYFEMMLARYGSHKVRRSPEGPRFGADLERSFGSYKSFIADQVPGNTNNGRRGRAVSPSHRPEANAVLSIGTTWSLLERYFFEVHNGNPTSTGLLAPRLKLQEGLATFPFSGIDVEYNDEFIIGTAIPSPYPKYKIDRSRGIKVNGRWHWSPDLMLSPDGYARGVLEEPWDESIVYVPMNGKWAICHSAKSKAAFSVDSIGTMLDSTCRLEAREALRLLKEHKDDETAALLKASFNFLTPSTDIVNLDRDEPSRGMGNEESIPVTDVEAYDLEFETVQ